MLQNLIELRRRSLLILGFFSVLFGLFYLFSPTLFHTLVLPLLDALPKNEGLIATQILTPLVTPITMAADAAMLGTAPFALFHAWCFAAPGLYQEERRSLRWIMFFSILLFCAGGLICYYFILPTVFQCIIKALPADVRFLPDMGFAIDFTTHMVLLFGLCFQIPLVCFFMVRLGFLSIDMLIKIRPYVIVLAFILGMLLTPPDVLSQILLAIPLWLLYESGIFFARFIRPKKFSTDLMSTCEQPEQQNRKDLFP